MPNGNEPTASEWSNLGWAEWKGRVGAKLETVEKGQSTLFRLFDAHRKEIAEVREELGNIKGKAAAFGAVSGIIVTLILAVIMYAAKPVETIAESAPVEKSERIADVEQRPDR